MPFPKFWSKNDFSGLNLFIFSFFAFMAANCCLLSLTAGTTSLCHKIQRTSFFLGKCAYSCTCTHTRTHTHTHIIAHSLCDGNGVLSCWHFGRHCLSWPLICSPAARPMPHPSCWTSSDYSSPTSTYSSTTRLSL